MKFLKPDLTAEQALDDGTLTYTSPAITKPFKLESITLKADANITETIIITRLSGSYKLQASPITLAGDTKASDYDAVMATVDLIAEQDFVFRPQGQANFQPGEQIKVQCSNDNKSGQTVYVSIKRSELR